MNIEFVFNDIKDDSVIYHKEEKYLEDWGDNITEISYIGTQYCENIVEQLKEQIAEIQSYKYNGQTQRIAHEDYTLKTASKDYSLSFIIDTYDAYDERKPAQLSIRIFSDSEAVYDITLEKIKIFIKQLLIDDWKSCTWIIDEQSENLGMRLYPLIYKCENKMRAFVSKVLTKKFGVRWMNLLGFESVVASYKKNSADFKRTVPEFNNINDILISATVEALLKLITKTKIYEPVFDISDELNAQLYSKIAENNASAVFDAISKARKVKVDIWEDVFSKYFDETFQKKITDFTKNRNHVAHNKLLTKSAYEIIRDNILEVEGMFGSADEKHSEEEPSQELVETWQCEQEAIETEKEYIKARIKDETGIDILSECEIFDLFTEKIFELHAEIDDSEYFNYAVNVGKLNRIELDNNKQILFAVNSNVKNEFSFKVCSEIEISDGMDEDSYINLWIEKFDESVMLNARIMYHNGAAHEDYMECYYVPDSESYFESDLFNEFILELKDYIQNEMNPIKVEVDSRLYLHITEGETKPVADLTCWNCNQAYISIGNELYPYGHCINCGEANEISTCVRCGEIYLDDDGFGDLCAYCFDRVNKE